MKHICILPRHNAISLSKEYDFSRLQAHPQPQIFAQPHASVSVQDRLREIYTDEAALVQYVLTRTDNNQAMPVTPRLKEESLKVIDPSELYVSMEWVILDWDLPSKGIPWGDPSKPETEDQIKSFISSHPRLKHAYAYFFSKSGVRIMYSLSNPLKITTSEDVLVWKSFFRKFVADTDISQVGGELELKADPFTLNRVPNYTKADGSQVTGELIFQNTKAKIRADYPSAESVQAPRATVKKVTYGQLPPDLVKGCLWHEPFLTHLRESKESLSYQDWRALGTNIAALLGDEEGFKVFDEISSWDSSGYNPQGVSQQWPSIVKSSEDYGPVTWSQFNFDLHKVYDHFNSRSSLAARVRRAVGDIQIGNSNPLEDNTQEVMTSLEVTTKMQGDVPVTKVVKTPTNLYRILTLDNRWKNQIRRNHLGGVDMLGDMPLRDEDIIMIREIISRVYGLIYPKDEIFDVVKLIAVQNEFHPVSDYFDTLKWDGVSRIEGLAKALGQSEEFSKTLLRRFLVSAVVRPLEWDNYASAVNWKIDTVLILKGSQGKRKSSFFKALCSDEEWFSDNLPSITHMAKDASMHMLGKWIVEQAEFEGHVARSSVEMMKAFITREREIFRKPYGRQEVNMRRPSVLVGTTNSPSFLNDPTGDRRFWVLEIPDSHTIDLAWVQKNRDQLWAEAVALYRKGEPWWLTEAETKKSNAQNKKFRRPDALWEAVLDFVNTNPTMAGVSDMPEYEDTIGFTLKQLVSTGLDKKLADLKSYETLTITQHLTKLGYEKTRLRVNGQRTYMYRKLKDFNDEEVY